MDRQTRVSERVKLRRRRRTSAVKCLKSSRSDASSFFTFHQ